MDKLYLDLAITVFFLVAMVFVANLRSLIQTRDKVSFKVIFSGLSVLAVMSLFTAVQNQLIIHQILSAGFSTYAEFLRMTMFIVGLVLLTTGVTRWLSSSVNYKQRDSSLAAGNLVLNRALLELSDPVSLTDFITTSLNLLADKFNAKTCAVYAVSKSGNRARLVAQETRFTETAGIDTEIVFTPGWINGLTDSTLTYADHKVLSTTITTGDNRYCFSVRDLGRPKFLFVIQSRENLTIQTEGLGLVQAISNTFHTKLVGERHSLRKQLDNWCNGVSEILSARLNNQATANEMISESGRFLRDYVELNYMSISTFDRTGRGRRITIGESGTILNEVDLNVFTDSGYLLEAINSNSLTLRNDLKDTEYEFLPEILKSNKIESIAVLPLTISNSINGAITIGRKSRGQYTAVEQELVKSLDTQFERIYNQIIIESYSADVSKREKQLREFVVDLSISDTETKQFQLTAALMAKITGSSFVRVSSIDTEQKFITSRAIENNTQHNSRVPDDGLMMLSILPWHKVAVENGNTVIVNSGDTENKMPEIETSQVFVNGITESVIVPIKYGTRVYGVISLGVNRAIANTISPDQIQFAETVASLLALTLDASKRTADTLTDFAVRAKSEIIESGRNKSIRNHMRAPITSIIGSLEMIRAGESTSGPGNDRYLSMIDRSARKLEELLKK